MIDKIARCLICNEEFTKEDLTHVSCCPKCGNSGLPADPKDDVTIKINWHELRILTIWAENWAARIKDETKTQPQLVVACIARRIQKQHPDKTPLTLAGEIEQIKKETDFKITETNIDDRPNKIAGEFNA